MLLILQLPLRSLYCLLLYFILFTLSYVLFKILRKAQLIKILIPEGGVGIGSPFKIMYQNFHLNLNRFLIKFDNLIF